MRQENEHLLLCLRASQMREKKQRKLVAAARVDAAAARVDAAAAREDAAAAREVAAVSEAAQADAMEAVSVAQKDAAVARSREMTAKQDIAIRKGTATILRSHAEASEMNCGSLETCSIDDIMEGVPTVDDAMMFERYSALFAEKPMLPADTASEIPAMHDFFARVLQCARPPTSVLAIRHELKARVRDSNASIIPDYSLSHQRNATFSMHTMDFCLELKRRRRRRKLLRKRKIERLILRGNAQAMDYATRKAGSCQKLLACHCAFLLSTSNAHCTHRTLL